ncbi:hypothetical protein ACTFIW_007801, partial [Dictyostelium discoideum]
IK